MIDFGKGPALEKANPWLRDEVERIEGLPPFSEEMRRRLRAELAAPDAPGQSAAE